MIRAVRDRDYLSIAVAVMDLNQIGQSPRLANGSPAILRSNPNKYTFRWFAHFEQNIVALQL